MICITGANGFIGKALTINLLENGQTIKTQSKSSPRLFPTKHFNFSLDGKIDLEFLNDCETLVHLACSLDKRRSNSILKDIDTEVKGSANLFENFMQLNPKGRIVFLSTGGAIYDSSTNAPHRESDPTSLDTAYALTKHMTENVLSFLCKQNSFKAVTLRVSNPYGEVFSGRTQGIIGLAASKLKTNGNLSIFENVKTTRDYIHISDVIDAISASMSTSSIRSGTNEVINIGSGVQTPLSDLIQLINSISGKNLNYELSNQESPPTFNCLDITKARTLLNWGPQISLNAGLALMLSKENSL